MCEKTLYEIAPTIAIISFYHLIPVFQVSRLKLEIVYKWNTCEGLGRMHLRIIWFDWDSQLQVMALA